MRRFEGKTVIVTGGGTGIGEAICHRFGDEGANVVIAELESDNGQGTAADINGNGGARCSSRQIRRTWILLGRWWRMQLISSGR